MQCIVYYAKPKTQVVKNCYMIRAKEASWLSLKVCSYWCYSAHAVYCIIACEIYIYRLCLLGLVFTELC